MKGLERAYQYYLDVGAPMIHSEFPFFEDRIAVGLVGRGSECWGYDDDTSLDHDNAVGFCLWLTDQDYRRIGKDLEIAYRALPRPSASVHTGMGSEERGVKSIGDFFRPYVGELPQNNLDWLRLDERYLAEATNGKVWRDDLGEFSRVRNALLDMPKDVRLQKMAAHAIFAAQSGQYNYPRCVSHGQLAAAAYAKGEFCYHVVHLACLLAGRYAPYYKWMYRALDEFELGKALRPHLERLATQAVQADKVAQDIEAIDAIAAIVIAELRRQDLSAAPNDYLEPHAYQIRRGIQDPEIKALHVMTGV